MRLERVVAKDSRSATEQVIARYGPDALIVSNQRVNGMTEIVVAVDIDQAPVAPRVLDASANTRSMDGNSAATESGEDWPPASFSRSLQESLRVTNASESRAPAEAQSTSPRADPLLSASRQTAPSRPAAAPLNEEPAIPANLMRQETAEIAAQDEALRARELVDMVRNELAGMRREMALSRQLDAAQPVAALPEVIRPVAAALIEAGVPAALRTLLLDGVRDAKQATEALTTMKAQLSAAVGQAGPAAELAGIQALIGPSGSGKTLMASRLAARQASSSDNGSVAIISFADHRIGAWTQCQLMAARIGVDCFRVNNADLLGPMLDELASRRLVLIDTPSAGVLDLIGMLQSSVPAAGLNLVIPADASTSSLGRFLGRPATQWRSLMATKLDEAGAAWPMIQALCNQSLALSFASESPAGDKPALTLTPSLLIEAAFAQLPLQLPDPVPAPAKARSSRTTRSSTRTGASRAA